MMGWNPPPHPFEIVPSVRAELGDADVMTFPWSPATGDVDAAKGNFQINAVLCLFDFGHEDELLACAGQLSTMLGFWTRPLRQGDARVLAHFYLHPEAYKGASVHGSAWSDSDVDHYWNNLQTALETVVPRRLALGPLPDNVYSDPITVYFYDTGILKRQTYPLASLNQSTDVSNTRWWASSGAGIEDYDPITQTWNGEGFSTAKDFGTDVATQLVQAVLAAISIVLTFTGVGAPLAAMVQLLGQGIIAAIQTISAQINGGDPTAAILQLGTTMINYGSSAFKLSPKLTQTLATTAGTGLRMLAAHFDANTNPAAADPQVAFDTLKAKAASIPMLDEGVTLLYVHQLLNAAYGGDYVGTFDVFFQGYWYAQFASSTEIATLTPIMGQIATGATLALWKMGTQIGALVRTQKQRAGTAPLGAALSTTQAHAVTPTAATLDPRARLMTYVVTVLKPRYHL